MHNPASAILLLLTAVVFLAIAGRRLPIPYPTLMVISGAALGWLPGLPHVEFDSDTVLLVFLPPLLYAAAWQMSWSDFRANLRPISLLAVGLVVATTAAVAWLAHHYFSQMPWSVAIALGALVAPPDAVAATAITQRLKLPKRLNTILEGESLVNDATALVIFRIALAAAIGRSVSYSEGAVLLLTAPIGGILIGLAVGWLAVRLHQRFEDPTIETAVTLLTPFAAFIPAELTGVSGVLAIVSAGMYASRCSSKVFSPATRLHATAVWNVLVFLLNGLAFILIGLQIPSALRNVRSDPFNNDIRLAFFVCLTVIVVRLLWIFPAAAIPRWLSPSLRKRDPMPGIGELSVIGWCGMRGVVTVAAAIAIPTTNLDGTPFEYRDAIVLISFSAVLFTLVVQGQSLPLLIRWVGLSKGADLEAQNERQVRHALLTASIDYLKQAGKQPHEDTKVIRHLQDRYEHLLAEASILGPNGVASADSHSFARIQKEVLLEQRRKLSELSQQGLTDLESCRHLERIIDLEEARIEELPGEKSGRSG